MVRRLSRKNETLQVNLHPLVLHHHPRCCRISACFVGSLSSATIQLTAGLSSSFLVFVALLRWKDTMGSLEAVLARRLEQETASFSVSALRCCS